MATQFDSFDRSPLGDFIQSPLLARGPASAPGIPSLADLSFNVNPTATARRYPLVTTYPLYSIFIPNWVFRRDWRLENPGTEYEQWVMWRDYSYNSGGDLLAEAHKTASEAGITRAMASSAFVPYNLDPAAYCVVRVNSGSAGANARAAIYLGRINIPTFDPPCDFYGFGSFIGWANPTVDNYFNVGQLAPGYWSLFAHTEDDESFGNFNHPSGSQNFWAGNDGSSIRLEIRK